MRFCVKCVFFFSNNYCVCVTFNDRLLPVKKEKKNCQIRSVFPSEFQLLKKMVPMDGKCIEVLSHHDSVLKKNINSNPISDR